MQSFRFIFLGILSIPALASPLVETRDNVKTFSGRRYDCKCYPGDRCWPSSAKWRSLNNTVGGFLKEVVPDAAVCYNTFEGKPTYNAAACQYITENFSGEQWTTDRDVANLWMFWTNNTCLPTTNPSDTCTLGFYPEYVILAKTKEHVKAGIDFARENNVRLVIRNTGHDFLGRSTGFGSLAINTHGFKDVEFIKKYTGPGTWRGSAAKVGAGVQGRELLRQAFAQTPKVAIVTGECPTVGFAGGFIQGGGHGPLASFHGMAADQALSYEVITADGQYRTANAAQNPELFWALKGGGPSTFATILSVTVKTFPETPTAGIVLHINSSLTTDEELFWRGFHAFHNLANLFVENGIFVYYELFPGSLKIKPIVGPNMNAAKIKQITKPLFDKLDKEGVPYDAVVKEFPTFFELYIDLFEDEASGANMLVGGRIFTKRDIKANADAVSDSMRQSLVASQSGIVGHIVGPGTGAPIVDNAIHPRWRDAASLSLTIVPLPLNSSIAEEEAAQDLLTNRVDAPLRAASPFGAAYVNEGNLEEPNWQQAFWGSNYQRLYTLKKKWDPKGVFYARTTPGTEDWEVTDYNTRLCRRL